MKEELKKLLDELVKTTKERDEYEIEHEYEKARLLFSAEVNSLTNQTMRDAQVTLMLHESGLDRKIAEARTNAKIAYYKWSSIKSLIDGRE